MTNIQAQAGESCVSISEDLLKRILEYLEDYQDDGVDDAPWSSPELIEDREKIREILAAAPKRGASGDE